MADIAAFLTLIKKNEGDGLDLTPSDPGNWTGGAVGHGELHGSKCGISAAAYPTLDIASLTDAAIAFLYRRDYLDAISFDALPPKVGLLVADCAVNQGVYAAAVCLQEALGVDADGVIGPITIGRAQARAADEQAMLDEIMARRALAYAGMRDIPIFGLGWYRRLIRAFRAAEAA